MLFIGKEQTKIVAPDKLKFEVTKCLCRRHIDQTIVMEPTNGITGTMFSSQRAAFRGVSFNALVSVIALVRFGPVLQSILAMLQAHKHTEKMGQFNCLPLICNLQNHQIGSILFINKQHSFYISA